MRIIKNLANSMLVRTFNHIKKNPKNLLYIILFDALFFVSAYEVNQLRSFLPGSYAWSVLQLILLLFLASCFKFFILDYVRGFFDKAKFRLNRIWGFFTLNLIIWAAFALLIFAVNVIVVLAFKMEYSRVALSFVAIFILFFLYAALNISHSFFALGNGVKDSLKATLKGGIRNYVGIYLFSALAFFAYILFFTVIGYAIQSLIKSELSYSFTPVYIKVFVALAFVLIYALMIFNRVYFCEVANVCAQHRPSHS